MVGTERRQVFDIPKIDVKVTEHRLVSVRCDCGCISTATPPAGVVSPVQYGPNVTAIVVYLYCGQFLSKKRTPRRSPNCSVPRSRPARSPR
ncbi:hypothetical protein GTY41_33100 [Streptomyces sp. SID685]|uniref:IS66 family transposase zinc-finger binding domain-containing protein n=1 Tax=Streptomyces griseofuscus TaxID=146922 RepID=UPI00136A1611|nr:hypothetical protein [Streptomyces sp. SID685]